jgi:hypothetical protein
MTDKKILFAKNNNNESKTKTYKCKCVNKYKARGLSGTISIDGIEFLFISWFTRRE